MMTRKSILIVDDEPNNLAVLKQILQDDYRLYFAKSAEKALELAAANKPDLILSDIMMPVMDGYALCERLKQSRDLATIPVIFVSAMGEITDEARGFAVGCVDYITKPVSAPLVKARVKTHLSLVRASELEDSQRAAIYMLGEAGHYNDTDTGVHIWRMAAYSAALARAHSCPEERCDLIELTAPMHDTGKIGIPDAILKKSTQLTATEWKIMKTHAQIGYDILSKSRTPLFGLAATIALTHHERWDGSGYPQGLKGEKIPLAGRIVAVADVFDALTMKRPYKEAWSIEDSMAEIRKGAGTHFDPALVALFENILPLIITIRDEWNKKESFYP